MTEDSTSLEIRKGLLVVAVLQVIGYKKAYAAEILTTLNKSEFATQEGTLYPLLSKLKREGLINHEWVESVSGPPRKYYTLSSYGKKRADYLMRYMSVLETQLTTLGVSHKTRGTKK